ncbi:unnamed protein product [Closterium sp. Naga37s-1]|nr:unnamed protein product [Closterium sp. Naga37s-1]
MMLVAYACYLYFQLKTHSHLYDDVLAGLLGRGFTFPFPLFPPPPPSFPSPLFPPSPSSPSLASPPSPSPPSCSTHSPSFPDGADGDDDDDEEQVLGFWGMIKHLFPLLSSILPCFSLLVYSQDGGDGDDDDDEGQVDHGAADAWDTPVAFINVILLSIVGNVGAADAWDIPVAFISFPFCVVVGWAMGVPMDLIFHLFETATLYMTVLVIAALLQEGESSYFKGIMLVLSYLIDAASFYVHNDIEDPDNPLPMAPASAPSPMPFGG